MVAGKEAEGAKFRDYFEHTEPFARVPSHRALAMFRGRNEGILHLNLVMHAEEQAADSHPCEAMVAGHWKLEDRGRPADQWLRDTGQWVNFDQALAAE